LLFFFFNIINTVRTITRNTVTANIKKRPWIPRISISFGFSLERTNVEDISTIMSIPTVVDLFNKRNEISFATVSQHSSPDLNRSEFSGKNARNNVVTKPITNICKNYTEHRNEIHFKEKVR